MSYSIIASKRGEEVLYYREFGCYQGEWLLISKINDFYKVYISGFGSCSVCDSLQSFREEFDYEDIPEDKMMEFVNGYNPTTAFTKKELEEAYEKDNTLWSFIHPRFGTDFWEEDLMPELQNQLFKILGKEKIF